MHMDVNVADNIIYTLSIEWHIVTRTMFHSV